MRLSFELAKNGARRLRLHDDKSPTCLAQRILSFRPKVMFLKVGGVDYRQMRPSHTGIVASLWNDSGRAAAAARR